MNEQQGAPMPTLAECVEALKKGNRVSFLVTGAERLYEWYRYDADLENGLWSRTNAVSTNNRERLTSKGLAEKYLALKPSHNQTPILLVDLLVTVAVLPKRRAHKEAL